MTGSTSLEKKKLIQDFNRDVLAGHYSTESPPCLCGSRDLEKISEHDYYGLWFPFVICRRCGLMFGSPRLTAESYGRFYGSDVYRKIYDADDMDYLEAAEKRFSSSYGEHIYQALQPHLAGGKDTTILEIGCGAGWNLFWFHKQGCSVRGYDYSRTLTDLGRSRGMDLHTGSVGDVEGQYDIILINHVLEHMTDIPAAIAALRDHLAPGGLMYIAVPDMDHFGMGQIQNAHVYCFTSRTFIHFMAAYGLKAIQHGPSETIHTYGIFEQSENPGDAKPDLFTEYRRMIPKIRAARIRQAIRRGLAGLGLESFSVKLYQKLKGVRS